MRRECSWGHGEEGLLVEAQSSGVAWRLRLVASGCISQPIPHKPTSIKKTPPKPVIEINSQIISTEIVVVQPEPVVNTPKLELTEQKIMPFNSFVLIVVKK